VPSPQPLGKILFGLDRKRPRAVARRCKDILWRQGALRHKLGVGLHRDNQSIYRLKFCPRHQLSHQVCEAIYMIPGSVENVPHVFRSLHQHSKNTTVFSYRFDHSGSFSVSDVVGVSPVTAVVRILGKVLGFDTTQRLGACHGDDIIYLFRSVWH
jgi:hypothetical protein